jgi:hypothetical protein
MSQLYTIKDERTVYCRAAMKANGGEWNPVTRDWLIREQLADFAKSVMKGHPPRVQLTDAIAALSVAQRLS